MNSVLESTIEKVQDVISGNCKPKNIATSERILSVVAGGLIFGIGITRLFKKPLSALTGVGIGGALIVRGATGHCCVKDKFEKISDEEQVTVVERRYYVK